MAASGPQPTTREDERFSTEWVLFDPGEPAGVQEPHQSGDAPLAGRAPVSPHTGDSALSPRVDHVRRQTGGAA